MKSLELNSNAPQAGCYPTLRGQESAWHQCFYGTFIGITGAKSPLEMRLSCIYSLDNTTKRGGKLRHAVQQANPTGQM